MPGKHHYKLTDERIAVVVNLVGQIVQQGKGFKVYPPKQLTDDPSVLQSDDVVDRLGSEKFWVRLSSGTEELLALPELLALAYNLLAFRRQLREAIGAKEGKGEIKVEVNFALAEMLKPENARALLQRVTFEGLGKPD